jgi:5-methyltetrahydropteroyltriglutamate--homocysteine methyltransferase
MPPSRTSSFKVYQHGIFPRSEAVVRATRDLEHGRGGADTVDEVFRADREAFLDLQQRAGLDYLSDGLLRWQDLFRPLVEASEGLEARVLVRWFDNNSFFRAPQVVGDPRLNDLPGWVTEDGLGKPGVATLPSPYLFSRAAHGPIDPDGLMVPMARQVLAPAVAQLVEAGRGMIHLEEPWLVYHGIEERSWEPFADALAAIREAAAGAPVVLHTYYGNAAPYAERLRSLPVDAIGIDFDETDLEELPAPWGTGLLAGVLDGRRSVTESAGDVSDFVAEMAGRLQPSMLFVSSGSELELSGPQVAPKKVEALGRAAEMLRGIL